MIRRSLHAAFASVQARFGQEDGRWRKLQLCCRLSIMALDGWEEDREPGLPSTPYIAPHMVHDITEGRL